MVPPSTRMISSTRPTEGCTKTRPEVLENPPKRTQVMKTEVLSAQLDSGSICWLEIGEGKPLVFLHGFPDTPLTFSGQLEFFAKRAFRCMAPYLPGYGPSSLPKKGGTSLWALMGMIEEFLVRNLRAPQEGLTLIGHDWGSVIAQMLAYREHIPLRRVVLVSVPPLSTLLKNLPLTQLWHSRYMLFFQIPGSIAWVRFRKFAYIRKLWKRWSPDLSPEHPQLKETLQVLSQGQSLKNAILYYRYALNPVYAAMGGSYVRTLKALVSPKRLPCLTVYGENDGCMVPKAFQGSEAAFPHPLSKTLSIPKAGHFVHLEKPEAFNRALMDFIEKS